MLPYLCGYVTYGAIQHHELNLISHHLIIKTEEPVPAYETFIIQAPFSQPEPFWTLGFKALLPQESPGVFEQRSSRDGTKWGTWTRIEEDDLGAMGTQEFFSKLIFFEKDIRFVQLRVKLVTEPLQEWNLFFTSPGKTATQKLKITKSIDRPSFVSRKSWGCPQAEHVSSRELTYVTHIVVHHSAANTISNDFAAVVRSYWDYHVNGHKWDDIGYNWLVDKNGVLYKGRAWKNAFEEHVKGAHNSKKNSNTVGICLIGNYQQYTPSVKSLDKLTSLMAFLSSKYGIDPVAQRYHTALRRVNNTITGHKQSGGGTLCPGKNIIGQLNKLRENTKNKILAF